MRSTRFFVASSIIKDFCSTYKKSLLSFAAVFFLGVVIGIFIAINSSGGEFERIARADMEFGAVKMFFLTSLLFLLCYGVILISAYGTMLSLLSLAVFITLGIFFGKYMCLLIACYEVVGILNLIFIYIPFFMLGFVCMAVAAVLAVSAPSCEACCSRSRLRPSFIIVLKMFGINLGCNFVIFILIGALTKVVVIGL